VRAVNRGFAGNRRRGTLLRFVPRNLDAACRTTLGAYLRYRGPVGADRNGERVGEMSPIQRRWFCGAHGPWFTINQSRRSKSARAPGPNCDLIFALRDCFLSTLGFSCADFAASAYERWRAMASASHGLPRHVQSFTYSVRKRRAFFNCVYGTLLRSTMLSTSSLPARCTNNSDRPGHAASHWVASCGNLARIVEWLMGQ
jgi:hypothetical protein